MILAHVMTAAPRGVSLDDFHAGLLTPLLAGMALAYYMGGYFERRHRGDGRLVACLFAVAGGVSAITASVYVALVCVAWTGWAARGVFVARRRDWL